jgi:hypothetical protein
MVKITTGAFMILLLTAPAGLADDEKDSGTFKAGMSGYEQVLPVRTKATGSVDVKLQDGSFTVTLSYENLTTAPTSAQLRWGQAGVTGPLVLTICGAPSSNTCPADGAEATFTFNVQALQAVNNATPTGFFPAADLEAFRDALRAGVINASVQTQRFANGEIRGQLGLGNRGSSRGSGARDEDDGGDEDAGNGKGKGKDKDK